MMLLALSACDSLRGVPGAPGATAGTVYDQTTDFIEIGGGKVVKTVVSGTGKLAGYVIFDAALRTPLYFVGLSSGPFANRSDPKGLDKYLLNPMQDGYDQVVDWIGGGASWTTETTVRVVTKGGKMIVEQGGNVLGEVGKEMADTGTSVYRDIPSFGVASGVSALASPQRPAMAPAPTPASVPTPAPASVPRPMSGTATVARSSAFPPPASDRPAP
jgi:hypothetical protein